MWTYAQRQGTMRQDTNLVGIGYSGHGDGKNCPDMQNLKNLGPIPQGKWHIVEKYENYPPHGPFVLRLQPSTGTETFGRSGFLIHGDMRDPAFSGMASTGCIILPRIVREEIWDSGDRELRVVADDEVGAIA